MLICWIYLFVLYFVPVLAFTDCTWYMGCFNGTFTANSDSVSRTEDTVQCSLVCLQNGMNYSLSQAAEDLVQCWCLDSVVGLQNVSEDCCLHNRTLPTGQDQDCWALYSSAGPYLTDVSVKVDSRWVIVNVPVHLEILAEVASPFNLSSDHTAAVEAAKLSKSMVVATSQAVSKSQKAVLSAMKTVYFAAQNNCASSLVPKLNELLIEQGLSQLADLKVDEHTNYSHNSSLQEFQSAIAGVLEQDLLSKVNDSVKFSLMLDESTDVSVHQNLVVYIRLLETDALGYVDSQTYFLGIDQLERATADSIFSHVVDMLSRKGIQLKHLCGVSTDGASVMVGNRSGVVTRLKGEVPGILATHCIAHRLALSCCNGADAIPYLVKFQELLNSVYKYFHFSPKNMARLEAIQNIGNQGHSSKFKEVFHTRWLSFGGSVDAMVSNYSDLISVFLEESSGKALSLHKPLSCFKFLYVLHFLSDVLKPLVVLSKCYQKSDIDYSQVTPLLTSTISQLEVLRDEKKGQSLSEFLNVVPVEPLTGDDGLSTFEFKGHAIRDSVKQRHEAESVCAKFVDGMVKSLNSRFSDNEDAAVLTSLSIFFNPALGQNLKSSDVEVLSDYLIKIGLCGFKDDLLGFLGHAYSSIDQGSKVLHSVKDMANFAIKFKDLYPGAAEAAARLLVAPVSTVDCERGFSRQNIIKTNLRNSLSVSTLENLMRISIDGPPRAQFKFEKAFELWAAKKARRILQK